MLYHLNKVEKKTDDWYVLSIKGLDDTQYEDVSVNKTDKAGSPQWDMSEFVEGKSINGNIWTSPKGKHFLFPIKEKAVVKGGAPGIKAAQERKAETIKEAQENRAQGVKVAAAMRDATLITLASLKDQPFPTDEEFQAEFIKWRSWYMEQWATAEKVADQPF